MSLFVLFESAIGYGLFELKEFDEVNSSVDKVLKEIRQFQTFSKMTHLEAFQPFSSSAVALSIIDSTLAGKAPQELVNFLTEHFPLKKKSKVRLGMSDNKMASFLSEALGIKTAVSPVISELMRGFRQHFLDFLKLEEVDNVDLQQSRLGLAHSFSRNKISLDVNRQDKPIIQSVGLLELLDKDINTFAMRIKEWYSWHYPELARLVSDNLIFVKLVQLVGDRKTTDVTSEQVEELVGDGEIADKVIESARNSMGQQITDFDVQCLRELCEKTLKMFQFRKEIQGYLKDRMQIVSPNLTSLIGESIAAKLISHSGSLATLAKYPASTIQILGAEKALFRALKQKTKTPKYGLLYNTTFIGRAIGKNKGKISRFLANKCAMAARLDHFLVNPTNRFGEKLKEQVERRLTRTTEKQEEEPEKNEELMEEIMAQLREQKLYFDSDQKYRKFQRKARKSKKATAAEEPAEVVSKKKKIVKA